MNYARISPNKHDVCTRWPHCEGYDIPLELGLSLGIARDPIGCINSLFAQTQALSPLLLTADCIVMAFIALIHHV